MLLDIETVGDIAGIIQISAEIVRMKMDRTKVGSDHSDGINRVRQTFNKYINPEVCPKYWDQRSIIQIDLALSIINYGGWSSVGWEVRNETELYVSGGICTL